MTPETQVSIALLISVSTFVFGAINFFSSRKKEIKSDNEALIKANMKLDQICATTNETRSDIKSINSQIKEITEQQIIQGQQIKELWRHINKLEGNKENIE